MYIDTFTDYVKPRIARKDTLLTGLPVGGDTAYPELSIDEGREMHHEHGYITNRNSELVNFPESALDANGRVTLWRVDEVERVERDGGFITARTILAREAGVVATYGFAESDIVGHSISDYTTRVASPSQSDSGLGSPFVSTSAHRQSVESVILDWATRRAARVEIALYRLSVDPARVVLPAAYVDMDLSVAPELLVVGDVMMDDVERRAFNRKLPLQESPYLVELLRLFHKTTSPNLS